MKTIIKRALSLILCAAFLFTLAACGANKDNKDDSEEGSKEGESCMPLWRPSNAFILIP